ncbi:hypothetical protein AB0E63_38995 [Kribbella sp. NPDC026596]|uniref:hypothetical protein n=1 Tax=Kribbella sp. NPDC026596 TaxID=3155122 RepID=UPI0034026A5B
MFRDHALATARSGATSAIIIVVLTATLLTLIHLESPTAHAKAAAPAATGGYGSGTLGPWQANTKVISSAAHVEHVVRTNGIVLFGDSIAVQDGAALGRLMAKHLGTSFAEHSWSGQPTSAAVDALAAWDRAYGLPRRIVMAVGTNDIFDPPAFTAQLDRAMRIAGPDRTVYWVNVQVSRIDVPASMQDADQRNSEWIDLQLQQARSRYPNLRIVPWAEFLAAHPERMRTDLRDGRHTTVPAGQNARNALILQTIQHS